MDDERALPFEGGEEVLPAPVEVEEAAAGERAERPAGERGAQRADVDGNPLDPAPAQARFEAAAEDLDFGQLGHGSILARGGWVDKARA
jgi:hypothetical protein